MYQNDYYFYNGELKNNKILAVLRFLIPSLFTFIRCSSVTRKSTIRLNRHVPHWSKVSFIAEHSEMIKIFHFTKNHKKMEY